MQSLISQITSLFAAQSIKSIENNGLQTAFTNNQDFSGVFETLVGDNHHANLAGFDGQPLPSAYTPISFQISQLTLTTQPSRSESGINIHAELHHADVSSKNITHTHITTSSDGEGGASNREQLTSIINLNNSDQDALINNFKSQADGNHIQEDAAHVTQTQIPNTSLISNKPILSNISAQPEKVHEIGPQTNSYQSNSKLNSQSTDHSATLTRPIIENNRSVTNASLNTAVNNYDVDSEKISYATNIGNQIDVNKSNSTNLDNKASIKIDNVASNASLPNLSEINTKQAASTTNNNSSYSSLDIDENANTSLLRSDVISKTDNKATNGVTNNSQNVQLQTQNFTQSNSQVLHNKELPQDITSNIIDESTENKPVYASNQQNDIRRNESSNINRHIAYTNSYESIAVNDKNFHANPVNHQADNLLESISIVNKNQEFSPEVKTLLNFNAVEKPQTLAQLTDISATSNKLANLDKSGFSFSASSEVANTDEVAQQITWAKHNNTSHVRIALSPEHLGALEINIEQDRDGLNIQFTTQNAQAKDAIEVFMPRLKDMLEQQGLNLQNANVSQQGNYQNSENYSQSAEQNGFDSDVNSDETKQNNQTTASIPAQSTNNHLIEEFA